MVIRSCLTIVFDGSFYKAILERHNGKDYSVATDKTIKISKHVNPKRAQRLANKVMKHQGISTKAQSTLQKQFEEKKKLRKAERSAKKRLSNILRYQKRVAKRRKKHRGH